MSQQIGGPTRYQKPEESGMPHAQPTAQAMTALIRNASGVDAQKTKSFCCVAAGITALARSTTEARIPHEKLRGAATAEATLNAQSGLLAQLAQGYKHHSIKLQCKEPLCLAVNNLRADRQRSSTSQSIYKAVLGQQFCKYDALLHCPSHIEKWLNHLCHGQFNGINPPNYKQLLLKIRQELGSGSPISRMKSFKTLKEMHGGFSGFSCNAANQPKDHLISGTSSLGSFSGLRIRNQQRRSYGSNTSNSLDPGWSVPKIEGPECSYNAPHSQQPTTHPNPENSVIRGELDSFHNLNPRKTIVLLRLYGFHRTVDGGAK